MTGDSSESPNTFGYNLRRIRRARDLTQKELADLVGVHLNTVLRAESGEQDTRWSVVEKLAQVLGVPTTEFSKPIPAIDSLGN